MKPRLCLPLFALLAATGCGPARHSIGDGALQKRKHQPGWHVDLGRHEPGVPKPLRGTIRPLPTRAYEPAISAGEPIAAQWPFGASFSAREGALQTPEPKNAHPSATTISAPSPTTELLPVEVVPSTPKARWNPWAIPAFLLALGTVAFAILGTSALVVVLAVVATLVLAAIAVRKGRTYEWRGKGFAIAALMIGSLAALVTLIALLVN